MRKIITSVLRELKEYLLRHFDAEKKASQEECLFDISIPQDFYAEAFLIERLLDHFLPNEYKYIAEGLHKIRSDTKNGINILKPLEKDFPRYVELANTKSHHKKIVAVDGIDGTLNYYHHLNEWGPAIGVLVNNEVVASGFYAIKLGEMFSSEKGEGAFLNEKPINASNRKYLNEALVVLPYYFSEDSKDFRSELLSEIASSTRGIRTYCVSNYELAYVAKGSFDACIMPFGKGSKWWDFVMILAIQEAGGKVTDLHGERWSMKSEQIIATNKHLHNPFIEIVRPIWKKYFE